MKLRLEVLRHELPVTRLLWQADEDDTVAELLSNLDPLVPLEAEHWGLEDYTLETKDGFEALHYQKLGDVLENDQHVRIRPLSVNDRRVRRLTGRSQIDLSGRRILDGVAFGRPLLRAPSRPGIHIPSLHGGDSSSDIEHNPMSLAERIEERPNAYEDGEDEDDVEDEDYDDEAGAEQSIDEESDSEEENDMALDIAGELSAHTINGTRTATISQALVLADHGNIEDEHGLDLAGRRSKPRTKRGTKRALSAEDSVTLSRKRVRWKDQSPRGLDASPDVEVPDDDGTSSESELSSSSSDSSESSDDQQDESDLSDSVHSVNGRPKVIPRDDAKVLVAPGNGKARTRQRNMRRKTSKKLAALKASGVLPKNATIEVMRQYEQNETPGQNLTPPQAAEESKGAAVSSKDSSSSSGSSSDESSDSSDDAESEASAPSVQNSKEPAAGFTTLRTDTLQSETQEFARRRQALLDQLAEGGVDVTNVDPATGIEKPESVDAVTEKEITEDEVPLQNGKRRKLDIGASQRLLLGSLGHRAPRTAEERAKLVDKLTVTKEKKPIVRQSATDKLPEESAEVDSSAKDDPGYWKAHIELAAVECCGPDVELTTPPFPFYQRWDSSQKQGKKRKRKSQAYVEEDYTEYEDAAHDENSYFANGYGEALNYDDVDADAIVDEEEEWQGVEDDVVDDDVPPLPEDVSALPALTATSVQCGDVLVYQVYEVSAANSWSPALSELRTATVLSKKIKTDEPLSLQLARRDMPDHRYDEQGNRLYAKFEMPQGEEGGGEEQDGVVELRFEELIGPKLLARADATGLADEQGRGALPNGASHVDGDGEHEVQVSDATELVAAEDSA